jgi:hypothetical protein
MTEGRRTNASHWSSPQGRRGAWQRRPVRSISSFFSRPAELPSITPGQPKAPISAAC